MALLAEWSLLTQEVRGSNPVINKFYIEFIFSTVRNSEYYERGSMRNENRGQVKLAEATVRVQLKNCKTVSTASHQPWVGESTVQGIGRRSLEFLAGGVFSFSGVD